MPWCTRAEIREVSNDAQQIYDDIRHGRLVIHAHAGDGCTMSACSVARGRRMVPALLTRMVQAHEGQDAHAEVPVVSLPLPLMIRGAVAGPGGTGWALMEACPPTGTPVDRWLLKAKYQ